MVKKYQVSENIIAYLGIIILFIINYFIVTDYGISIDEESTRFHGIVSLNYILNIFNITDTFLLTEKIPDLQSYEYKQYGVIFEIFLIFITEFILDIKEFSNIFFVRHFLTHSFFIFSVVCFYYLANNFLSNKFFSLLSSAILYTTPRIFGESFYNSKDIIFLSFFIFAIHFIIKFLDKEDFKNAIVASLFIAMLVNIRVIGFYLSLIVIFFLFNDLISKKKLNVKKIKILLVFFFSNILFIYILWPYLWESPFTNFLDAVASFSKYGWGGSILYLGDFHSARYLPWHYLFVWILATLSPYLIFIIILSYLYNLSKYSKNLLDLTSSNLEINVWKNNDDKKQFFIFIISIIPIFLYFILDPIVYNGWRHFYFLLPCFILISVDFYKYFINKIKRVIFKKILYIAILSIPILNLYNLVKLHPFQYIYFNKLFETRANDLFEIDFWGVANTYTLKKVLNSTQNDYEVFKIATGSFTDLSLSKNMLSDDFKNKLELVGQDYKRAEFIFSNNNFVSNPKYTKKFFYPLHFKEFYLLKRGKITINKIYKNNRN